MDRRTPAYRDDRRSRVLSVDDMRDDDLAVARGIVWACLASVVFWGLFVLGVVLCRGG
jgi:hypothetical protein